jgi:glycosyltransferase involved in cell wall biosynthesis
MRVALDAQLTIGTATGIGEYVRGLLEALRRRQIDVVELRDPALDPWRFDRRLIWDQLGLPKRVRASEVQLLHCAAGTMPRDAGVPTVVTVHDLAWHRVQAHAPFYARYYFGALSLRRYRRAVRVVVDSRFSRDELLRLASDIDPARVEVVYPGVGADFCELARREGDGRTILAVGTVERRKNLEVLVRALAHLPGARLVAIGPLTPYAHECEAIAREAGVADRFEMAGYVDRAKVLALYEECAVAAVPSRYEGFGYAAAQALCAGVPVVVSDRASLPEIASGNASVVAAEDAEAWAEALDGSMNGGANERARRVRPGAIERFAWERAASEMERIYAASINR